MKKSKAESLQMIVCIYFPELTSRPQSARYNKNSLSTTHNGCFRLDSSPHDEGRRWLQQNPAGLSFVLMSRILCVFFFFFLSLCLPEQSHSLPTLNFIGFALSGGLKSSLAVRANPPLLWCVPPGPRSYGGPDLPPFPFSREPPAPRPQVCSHMPLI